jgi:hypothetical protein
MRNPSMGAVFSRPRAARPNRHEPLWTAGALTFVSNEVPAASLANPPVPGADDAERIGRPDSQSVASGGAPRRPSTCSVRLPRPWRGDGAAQIRRAGNAAVEGDERGPDGLGERGVAGVVGGGCCATPRPWPRATRRATARSRGPADRRACAAWSALISPASSWRRMMFADSNRTRLGAASSAPASASVTQRPSGPESSSSATSADASQTSRALTVCPRRGRPGSTRHRRAPRWSSRGRARDHVLDRRSRDAVDEHRARTKPEHHARVRARTLPSILPADPRR